MSFPKSPYKINWTDLRLDIEKYVVASKALIPISLRIDGEALIKTTLSTTPAPLVRRRKEQAIELKEPTWMLPLKFRSSSHSKKTIL